jgi:hypothetical protein
MARKRKRTRIRPAPILALLLVANVAAGLFFSPITGLSKVRVVGVLPQDRERVSLLLGDLEGLPALRVDPWVVESRVAAHPEVRFADMRRNIFGRGLLTVTYRRPVASIGGSPGAALGSDGVVFRTSRSLDGLPEVVPPPEAERPGAVLAGVWPPAQIADFCQKLPKDGVGLSRKVVVDSRGALYLDIGGERRIQFGPADKLDEKLAAWRRFVADNPTLYPQVAELNVTAPSRAAYVLKTEEVSR